MKKSRKPRKLGYFPLSRFSFNFFTLLRPNLIKFCFVLVTLLAWLNSLAAFSLIEPAFWSSSFEETFLSWGRGETENQAKPQWSELIPQIRQFIQASMKEMGVPGLALTIVEKDKIILMEGFGLRDIEKNLPVTPKTCFILGSTTKAFTTLAMAILVEEGKLSWDEPVRKYLPEFSLKDEWATLRCTPRDLVTHRTGLPRHDLVWSGASLGPEEIIRVLAFLEPSRDFRTTYQYNNLMYIVAGVLISKVAGVPWEDFLKQRIFSPLSMNSSGCTVKEYLAAEEYSFSYRRAGDKLEALAFPTPDRKIMYGPRASGSVFSTAEDMAKWLHFHLNEGRVEGKQIISGAALKEMHTPQIVRPANPAEAPEIDHPSYGLGWMIDAYRGHYRVHHGGSTMGFSSYVAFFPREGFGIAILSNLNSNLPAIVSHFISDLALGLKPLDWPKRLASFPSPPAKPVPIKEGKLIRPVTDYVGQFAHPAYGVIKIEADKEKLFLIFREERTELQPQAPDLFRPQEAAWRRYPVRFLSNQRGEIEAVAIPFEPAVNDIIFTKRR